MPTQFFSRSIEFVVAAALGVAVLYAVVTLGPTAIDRWF
jgi:hypothetical protein